VQRVAGEPRTTTGEAAVAEIEQSLRSQLAAPGGAGAVEPQEVRRAVDELDPQVLAQIAGHVVAGEREQAKALLASHTSLDDMEVESILNGVAAEVRNAAEETKGAVAETTETASSYAQAALWLAFGSGALALLASIAGGTLGASSTRRYYLRHHHVSS
jgi:hypothetical protein